MLDPVRSKSKTFGVYLIFGTLIVAFAIGFGAVAPEQACGTGSNAHETFLKVEDRTINRANFAFASNLSGLAPASGTATWEDAYAWRFPFARFNSPFVIPGFNRDVREQSPVRQAKVADDLIESILVSQYMRSLGLEASSEELTAGLRPFLLQAIHPQTGKFSEDAYRAQLANYGGGPSSFEALMRDELLRERAIRFLVGEASVPEAALETQHRLESERVTVELLHINAQVAAPYIQVSDLDVEQALTSRASAISNQYESQKFGRYAEPKRFELRAVHIEAVDLSNRSNDEREALKPVRDGVKARAEAILEELRTKAGNGEDLANLMAQAAKTHSSHSSSQNEGRLGSLTLAELEQAPFSVPVMLAARDLSEGALSSVVEADNGYWILWAERIQEAKPRSLIEVQRDIAREQLQLERAQSFAVTLAEEIHTEAKRDPSKPLNQAVAVVSGRYQVSELPTISTLGLTRLSRLAPGFPLSSPLIPNVGARSPELVKAAFATSAEAPLLERVISVNEGRDLLIGRFLEHTPAPPLTDKDRQAKRLLLDLDFQRTLYRGWYEDFLADKAKAKAIHFSEAFMKELRDAEGIAIQSGAKLPHSVLPLP